MDSVSGASKTPQTSNEKTIEIKVNKWHYRVTWTLRGVFALIAAYYALGIAYSVGLMAYLDSLAIQVLPHYIGYAGMGAAMRWFQWNSAWAVRGLFAIGGAVLYDVLAKVFSSLYSCTKEKTEGFRFPSVPIVEPIGKGIDPSKLPQFIQFKV